jgi:hypothetical protein
VPKLRYTYPMNWVRTHKLITILVLIILFLMFTKNSSFQPLARLSPQPTNMSYGISESAPALGNMGGPAPMALRSDSAQKMAAPTDSRVVIQESNISLLVNDVRQTGDQVITYAKQQGGYMVNTSYTRPTESPFASITVRIPTEKLDAALQYFRSLGVKVTSENLQGTDVTQEYVDIEARLETLNKTKAKYEELLAKATAVADIVSVQQQLTFTQEQVDSLKGQQKSIDENAKLTRITIYLSTDELALPYAPDKVFRPGVIFKEAVRSLVTTIQGIGEWLIWIAVYSPLLLVAILLYFGFRKWQKRKLLGMKN